MYKYNLATAGYMHDDSASSSTTSTVVPNAGFEAYINEVGKALKDIVIVIRRCISLADVACLVSKKPNMRTLSSWYMSLMQLQRELQQMCEKTAELRMWEMMRMLGELSQQMGEFRGTVEHEMQVDEEDEDSGDEDSEDDEEGKDDEEDEGDDEEEEGDEEKEEDQTSEGSRYEMLEYSSDDWECVEDEETTEE